jgi:hypothetical protein
LLDENAIDDSAQIEANDALQSSFAGAMLAIPLRFVSWLPYNLSLETLLFALRLRTTKRNPNSGISMVSDSNQRWGRSALGAALSSSVTYITTASLRSARFVGIVDRKSAAAVL